MKALRTIAASTMTLALLSIAAFGQAPLTSALADLNCAKMSAYLTANAPVAPVVNVPTFEPNNSGAYIKASNLKHAIEEVYGGTGPEPVFGMNQYAAQQFGHDCNEWAQHGKSVSAIPAWPIRMYVSLPDFDSWYSAFLLRYDINSVFYGDDAYSDALGRNQYFKKVAPALPPIVILPATQAPVLPTSGNPVGARIPGSPFYKVAASGYDIGDKDPTGAYLLINPSPMNSDPSKYVWLKVN
jgi:hypothetical protein